jgi:hypothetical protein
VHASPSPFDFPQRRSVVERSPAGAASSAWLYLVLGVLWAIRSDEASCLEVVFVLAWAQSTVFERRRRMTAASFVTVGDSTNGLAGLHNGSALLFSPDCSTQATIR